MKRNSMKFASIILLSAVAAPLAFADKPATTQPARPMQQGRADGLGGGRLGLGGKRDGFLPGKPTAQEMQDTLAYVKENFPNHYDLFSRLPDNGPLRNLAMNRMAQRYRQLLRMQDQNPEAYSAMLRQAKKEDDAIGLVKAVKDKMPDADVRLREAVRQIVDGSLQERQERIEKLRRNLEEQEARLKEDQDNRDKLIADQIARTTQDFERMTRIRDRIGGNNNDAPEASKDVNALKN